MKVAFVDIPDDALDVINHYSQSITWEPSLIISNQRGSYGERMARIIGVPVDEFPRLEPLVQCDLVVIGTEASSNFALIREMLADTKVEVALLEDIRQRIVAESTPVAPASSAETGNVAAISEPGSLVADLDAAMERALNLAPEVTPEPSLPEAPPPEENPESIELDIALENFGPKVDPDVPANPIAIVGTEPSGAFEERTPDDDMVESPEIEETVVDLKVVGDTNDEFEASDIAEPEADVETPEVSSVEEAVEVQEPEVSSIEEPNTADVEEPEAAPAAPVATDLDARQQTLTRQLDRAMALEMSFSERLSAIGEILQTALGADYAHLFIIDSVSKRLELLTEPKGIAGAGGKFQQMDEGVFGWLIQNGRCHLATLSESESSEGRGIAFLTINADEPYGLLVLESFPVGAGEKEKVEDMLNTVVDQIEEIFEVEQGLETQDILSQIRLRITNRAAKLEVLPPGLRAQPVLEIAVEELAGEMAFWIPSPAVRPVITQPRNREAAKTMADAWDKLDEIAKCTRDKGSAVWGTAGSGWESTGPEGPAPYVAIRDENSDGILVFFWAREQNGETPARLPLRVLSESLLCVGDIIQKTADIGPLSIVESETDEDGTDRVLSEEELETRIGYEATRSERTGLPFALTRFTLANRSDEHLGFLRHFLLTNKRGADILAECEDGSMVVLSPDTPPESVGLRQRFSERWEKRGPDLELTIEEVEHPAVESTGHTGPISEEFPSERKTA